VQEDDKATDNRQEFIVGTLLRAGVIIAAIVVLVGGVMYLAQHGGEPASYRQFHDAPSDLTSVNGVVKDAVSLKSEGVVQLGLLLLILTPIARVVFSAVSFAIKGDRLYVVITLMVLAVLLFSLIAAK